MLQKYFYHCIDSCDDENDKLRNLRCNTTHMLMLTWKKLSEFVAKEYLKLTWDAGQSIYLGFHDPIWRMRIFFRWVGKNTPPPGSYQIYNSLKLRSWLAPGPPCAFDGRRRGWPQRVGTVELVGLHGALGSGTAMLELPISPRPWWRFGGDVWCRKFDGFAGSFWFGYG